MIVCTQNHCLLIIKMNADDGSSFFKKLLLVCIYFRHKFYNHMYVYVGVSKSSETNHIPENGFILSE